MLWVERGNLIFSTWKRGVSSRKWLSKVLHLDMRALSMVLSGALPIVQCKLINESTIPCFYIQQYNMKNNQSSGGSRIAEEDNAKIIGLIKSKINPLHTKTNYFPKLKMEGNAAHSQRVAVKRKKKEPEIVNGKELKSFDFTIKEPQVEIIQRAKTYIEEKKKKLEITEPEFKVDLSEYVRLFNKGEEEKEKKMMEEFLKMKRESMNFMSLEEKSYQIAPTEIKEFPNMSEEDQLEMNAKIRRRINHKKIIALAKNR